jgi:hypothetical protein
MVIHFSYVCAHSTVPSQSLVAGQILSHRMCVKHDPFCEGIMFYTVIYNNVCGHVYFHMTLCSDSFTKESNAEICLRTVQLFLFWIIQSHFVFS